MNTLLQEDQFRDQVLAANFDLALEWISGLVSTSLEAEGGEVDHAAAPPLTGYDDGSWLPKFIEMHTPVLEEIAIFMLALAPHLDPGFFDRLVAEHLPEGGEFPEFGGVKSRNHRSILPTGETAEFVLAGRDLERRLAIKRMFATDHWFWQKRILWLETVPEGEPAASGKLVIDPEIIEEITTGKVSRPRFSQEFPAEYIETAMDWDDLVLHPSTMANIREIENWIRYNDVLMNDWGMSKRVKPGYRALFHGLPGTGKTLTATLLGKHTGRPVFRVDLSRVVSKYIGETEQNLSRLFDKAENKDWIVFFDEADALFGKRTDIRDAHDKYANQELAYLLQRIEAYRGLVILASNQRGNIDDAFVRRLQTIVHFPMPGAGERLQIWRKTFPPQIEVADDIDWQAIASRHELSGANILNITHYCAVDMLAREAGCIDRAHLEAAIMREFVKEGKIV